ncbi:uncharacterized protein PSFLO_05276 [Pseudozyma flocculosa]|uniref:Uncharacterized protein n=1 Tax=Pseudozyma flocculosa TaxID=84751 RepID=A0A5C3F7U5_9BASI|nr:uncharacterized protein PSFLO_05276 [Pseudozyma flocculosa]
MLLKSAGLTPPHEKEAWLLSRAGWGIKRRGEHAVAGGLAKTRPSTLVSSLQRLASTRGTGKEAPTVTSASMHSTAWLASHALHSFALLACFDRLTAWQAERRAQAGRRHGPLCGPQGKRGAGGATFACSSPSEASETTKDRPFRIPTAARCQRAAGPFVRMSDGLRRLTERGRPAILSPRPEPFSQLPDDGDPRDHQLSSLPARCQRLGAPSTPAPAWLASLVTLEAPVSTSDRNAQTSGRTQIPFASEQLALAAAAAPLAFRDLFLRPVISLPTLPGQSGVGDDLSEHWRSALAYVDLEHDARSTLSDVPGRATAGPWPSHQNEPRVPGQQAPVDNMILLPCYDLFFAPAALRTQLRATG